jgi:RAD51-like protein 1
MSRLDDAMKGGLIIGTLTEICGPPGIGKTQFALSCCASALLDAIHLNRQQSTHRMAGGVVYYDTELKFPASRLRDFVMQRAPEMFSVDAAVDAPHRMDDIYKLVSVRQPTSCKELFEDISNLQDFVASNGISLVCAVSVCAQYTVTQ